MVSSPSMDPMRFSLIGVFFNVAGSLPARRMPTRKSTSSCVKLPVMRPLSLMVVINRGNDMICSSSTIPRWR